DCASVRGSGCLVFPCLDSLPCSVGEPISGLGPSNGLVYSQIDGCGCVSYVLPGGNGSISQIHGSGGIKALIDLNKDIVRGDSLGLIGQAYGEGGCGSNHPYDGYPTMRPSVIGCLVVFSVAGGFREKSARQRHLRKQYQNRGNPSFLEVA
ncbi:hypothetical protein KI387_008265, partial [Taxus chinensis]